jgi:hypothetical protein
VIDRQATWARDSDTDCSNGSAFLDFHGHDFNRQSGTGKKGKNPIVFGDARVMEGVLQFKFLADELGGSNVCGIHV